MYYIMTVLTRSLEAQSYLTKRILLYISFENLTRTRIELDKGGRSKR